MRKIFVYTSKEMEKNLLLSHVFGMLSVCLPGHWLPTAWNWTAVQLCMNWSLASMMLTWVAVGLLRCHVMYH